MQVTIFDQNVLPSILRCCKVVATFRIHLAEIDGRQQSVDGVLVNDIPKQYRDLFALIHIFHLPRIRK
jgi:hypothetical protein